MAESGRASVRRGRGPIAVAAGEVRRGWGFLALALAAGLLPFALAAVWRIPALSAGEVAGAAAVALTPTVGLLAALRFGWGATRPPGDAAADGDTSLGALWLGRLLGGIALATIAAALVALPSVVGLEWEAVEALEALEATVASSLGVVVVATVGRALWRARRRPTQVALGAGFASVGLATLALARLAAVGAGTMQEACLAWLLGGLVLAAFGAISLQLRIARRGAASAYDGAAVAFTALLATSALAALAGAMVGSAVDSSTLVALDELRQPPAGSWVLAKGRHWGRPGYEPVLLLDTATKIAVRLPGAASVHPVWLDGQQALWLEDEREGLRVVWLDLAEGRRRPVRLPVRLPRSPHALAASTDGRLAVLLPPWEPQGVDPRRWQPLEYRLRVYALRDGRNLGSAVLPYPPSRGAPPVALEFLPGNVLAVYDRTWRGASRYTVDFSTGLRSERVDGPDSQAHRFWLTFGELPGRINVPEVLSSVEFWWSESLPTGGWVAELHHRKPRTLRFTRADRSQREVVLDGSGLAAVGPQLASGELIVAIGSGRGKRGDRSSGWIVWQVDPEAGAPQRLASDRFPAAAERPRGRDGILWLKPGAPLLLLAPSGGLEVLDLDSGRRRSLVGWPSRLAGRLARPLDAAVLALARRWRRLEEGLRHPLASVTP